MRNFFLLLMGFVGVFNSQAQVNVSFTQVDINSKCYQISLQSISTEKIKLAGQNYRLYYDASSLHFNESDLESFLPKAYSTLTTVQNVIGDASGFGKLPFEKKLGFINLATDLHLSAESAIFLEPNKETVVAKLCFSESGLHNFVWAEQGITDGYATAFNEFSFVNKDGMLEKLHINNLIVKTSQIIDDIPLAFKIGNQSKSIEFDNKAAQVSEISQLKANKLKDQSFNKKLGRYVVLASINKNNENSKNIIEDYKEIQNEYGTYIFKYFNDVDQAKTYFRRFINIGFEDAALFSVDDNGSLLNIKKQ